MSTPVISSLESESHTRDLNKNWINSSMWIREYKIEENNEPKGKKTSFSILFFAFLLASLISKVASSILDFNIDYQYQLSNIRKDNIELSEYQKILILLHPNFKYSDKFFYVSPTEARSGTKTEHFHRWYS